MAGRVTKAEKERRLMMLQEWIIQGQSESDIHKKMREEWKLSLRQRRRYYKSVFEGWKHDEEITIQQKRDAKIDELKNDLRSLKPEFLGTPQGLNAKLRIHKMIIRLENIEPARKHHIEVEEKKTHEMSKSEREKRIDELLLKAKKQKSKSKTNDKNKKG